LRQAVRGCYIYRLWRPAVGTRLKLAIRLSGFISPAQPLFIPAASGLYTHQTDCVVSVVTAVNIEYLNKPPTIADTSLSGLNVCAFSDCVIEGTYRQFHHVPEPAAESSANKARARHRKV
jgi:hypothetical protein